MKKISHGNAAGALALAFLFILGGCSRKESAPGADIPARTTKPLTIGVSLLNLSSEFIVMLNKAMEGKAKELDVKLIVNDAQRSADARDF